MNNELESIKKRVFERFPFLECRADMHDFKILSERPGMLTLRWPNTNIFAFDLKELKDVVHTVDPNYSERNIIPVVWGGIGIEVTMKI